MIAVHGVHGSRGVGNGDGTITDVQHQEVQCIGMGVNNEESS